MPQVVERAARETPACRGGSGRRRGCRPGSGRAAAASAAPARLRACGDQPERQRHPRRAAHAREGSGRVGARAARVLLGRTAPRLAPDQDRGHRDRDERDDGAELGRDEPARRPTGRRRELPSNSLLRGSRARAASGDPACAAAAGRCRGNRLAASVASVRVPAEAAAGQGRAPRRVRRLDVELLSGPAAAAGGLGRRRQGRRSASSRTARAGPSRAARSRAGSARASTTTS